jgi:hypothetical protein
LGVSFGCLPTKAQMGASQNAPLWKYAGWAGRSLRRVGSSCWSVRRHKSFPRRRKWHVDVASLGRNSLVRLVSYRRDYLLVMVGLLFLVRLQIAAWFARQVMGPLGCQGRPLASEQEHLVGWLGGGLTRRYSRVSAKCSTSVNKVRRSACPAKPSCERRPPANRESRNHNNLMSAIRPPTRSARS